MRIGVAYKYNIETLPFLEYQGFRAQTKQIKPNIPMF